MAPTWTTKDGRTIPIADMGDDHLLNTVHYLRRHVPQYRRHVAAKCFSGAGQALAYAHNAPDGAAMAAESAADDMFNQAHTAMTAPADKILRLAVPQWSDLQAEIARRKLTELPL